MNNLPLPYETVFLISSINKHVKYEPACIRDAKKKTKKEKEYLLPSLY